MSNFSKMAEEEFDKMRKYLDGMGESRYVQEERLKLIQALAEFCREDDQRDTGQFDN